jgi:hypothetical protein
VSSSIGETLTLYAANRRDHPVHVVEATTHPLVVPEIIFRKTSVRMPRSGRVSEDTAMTGVAGDDKFGASAHRKFEKLIIGRITANDDTLADGHQFRRRHPTCQPLPRRCVISNAK